MQRRFNFSTTGKILSHVKYLPSVILQIKNWPDFLLHYTGLKNGGAEYVFRNGARIKTHNSISAATVSVVFIKKDYGEIPDNSVVIDIGANIGVFSVFCSFKKNVKVFAYEPMPDNFNLLQENIRINGLGEKIIPCNMGVAGLRGKKRLYVGESPLHSFLPAAESPFNASYGQKGSQEQQFLETNCVSLKDVFDGNAIDVCDVLKMDCEGAEYEILYNLPEDYFQRIINIRLEYHNHENNIKNTGEELLTFLLGKGFKVEKIRKGSLHQGDIWLTKDAEVFF